MTFPDSERVYENCCAICGMRNFSATPPIPHWICKKCEKRNADEEAEYEALAFQVNEDEYKDAKAVEAYESEKLLKEASE